MDSIDSVSIPFRCNLEQWGGSDELVFDLYSGNGVLYSGLIDGEEIVFPMVGSYLLRNVGSVSFEVCDEWDGDVVDDVLVNRFSQMYGFLKSGRVVEGAFDEFGFWDSDVGRVVGFDDGVIRVGRATYFDCRGAQEYRVASILSGQDFGGFVGRDVEFVESGVKNEFGVPRLIGVLGIVFVRRENGFEVVVMNRSSDVAVYPGRWSSAPNGGVDYSDVVNETGVIESCFVRELDEELFGGGGGGVRDMFDVFQSGMFVDGLRGDFQLMVTAVVNDVSDGDVLIDNMESSFEGSVACVPIEGVKDLLVSDSVVSPGLGVGLIEGVDVLENEYGEVFDGIEFDGWV